MNFLSITYLAAGQGSRDLVPLIQLAERSLRGKELLQCAADSVGLPVRKFVEQGGKALERTEVLQPVLTAISLFAHYEVWQRGVLPFFVAGHSLGEIAAWSMAGCITREDAVKVAAIRGRLMAREALRHPGGLLALVEQPDLERALAIGRAHGSVELGAQNAPDEIVVSGDDAALRAIAVAMPSRRLHVAGAWHNSAMKDAVEEFREALLRLKRSPMHYKMVLNCDGRFAANEDDIPHRLAEQLIRPIQWSQTMKTLYSAGSRHFVTMGPGAILRNLVRKNLGNDVEVFGSEGAADLYRTHEGLGGK